MSPKVSKGKDGTAKVQEAGVTKPSGKAPSAAVVSRHGFGEVTRPGRGFSVGELNAAGISTVNARGWGVRIDDRRRTSLESNISALRGWAAPTAAKVAKEGEVKKLEEELVKVEKEVGREIKKEGAKVKKGARKVEKEVAAAVEKPVKTRQRKKKAAKK